MVDNDHKRIDVGFTGGQDVSLRLTPQVYDDFRKAVTAGIGWYELETEDGPISLDLRQVVFVKSDSSEHKIGFSGL